LPAYERPLERARLAERSPVPLPSRFSYAAVLKLAFPTSTSAYVTRRDVALLRIGRSSPRLSRYPEYSAAASPAGTLGDQNPDLVAAGEK
jgi:hypothetical protein